MVVLPSTLIVDSTPFCETTMFCDELRPNSPRVEVEVALTVIDALGYLDEITGVYDATTTAAVTTFQRRNGLSVDGVAGSDTLKTLYSDSAKAY